MKKQEKLLRGCILVIAVTLAVCIGFVYVTRLREPVFLTYCTAVSAVPEPESGYHQPVLELQYLTNKEDRRTVTGISFLEAPEFFFSATENDQSYSWTGGFSTFEQNTSPKLGETIGRYSLRKIYVYMNNHFQKDWKGEVELNQARVQFNDGSTILTDLGRIILYSEDIEGWGFATEISSSSNQGEASTGYRVIRDITEVTLESPLLEDMFRRFELKVNGRIYERASEIECNKGDDLFISSSYREAGKEGAEYDIYDVRPSLSYTGEDGNRRNSRVYNIAYRKYFYSYYDVLKYLKNRGKI